ncbi:hypothetical protein [Methylomonas albis]|uniref:Uncharacterized protein n=1 Tax=Methylomonas albis TaxID=1854563 RepID=A0ABR9D6Z6_9GAMM|nr:hypothetical protein [Methylomonas albis]MBD9358720.1 hypothetical protein [Methylomonas albis]
MGYCDKFYIKENIIGYTGDLRGIKFTVYFADAGGLNPDIVEIDGRQQVLVRFGRITQDHRHKDNIGRGEVHECYSYTIFNDVDGKAKECVYGRRELKRIGMRVKGGDDEFLTFHPSRHRFESVHAGNIDILATAIARFPNAKPKVEVDE